ncbi:hypothetical protein F5888DRAFT_1801813 [Russula emetica]|nr:hypothetical protein F5888DRAFT_1801813 [Russula emetica]
MSLSVSSFPEAPPKLVRQPKWKVTLKSSGRFLGTLLSKRSVPFLKGIGRFAKTHVKESIIRQCANVSRSRSISKHHSTLSRSSIRSSSIVIDITPISNNDKYFSARYSDVDASSLNPTIEISLSPTISPAALSTPTAAKDIPAISPTDTVKAPYQSSVQSLVGDSAHAHETVVQHPAKEHEEVASDSEPHDPQPPDSEITTLLPISSSLTTQSLTVPGVPSTEGRRRSHSASAGVKASATETVSPTRPRYRSETAIDLPRHLTTTSPSDDPPSSEGKDSSRGENPIPQSPATGSTHISESTCMKKEREQRSETISKRARPRSGTFSKSTGSNKAVESPLLSAHMLNMRSAGCRLSANSHRPSTAPPLQSFTLSANALVPKSSSPEQMDHLLQAPTRPHLRPKMRTRSDVAASPWSRSPPSSLVVVGPGPSDDASEKSPLPSSVDRGLWLRLAAVPHAESWDGERQRRRPRTAPEAVLMASW